VCSRSANGLPSLLSQLEFRRQAKCQVLCRKVNSEEEGNSLAERIEQEYTVNW
tara:strand:+ start:295 stop:453 length:159 start_codon:yes stop_codon:yes gene_type:complete